MKFKLTPVECKYHELAKQVNRQRCVACGVYFLVDRKREKLHKHMDKMRKKK